MKRTRLHHKESGHLGQYEDDWYLVEDDDGTKWVSHEIDHVRVNGLQKTEGQTRIEIEDFLKGGHPKAVEKLKEILG